MTDGRKFSLAVGVAGSAWALAALVLILRLPVGTGGTDESFYSAMTYGFLLGNKPYLDELAFHQNAAIVLMPFYRAYLALRGTEGIILFNRWLYFAYIAFCSYLTYRVVTRFVGRAWGCWAAALVLAFTYYNLLALSYNTLGAFGFLCGVLFSVLALQEKPARFAFLALLFLGSAIFAYPTLLGAGALHVALVAWRLRRRWSQLEFRRALLGLGLGAFVCVAAAVAFIVWVTPAGIERALAFSKGIYSGHGLLATFADYREELEAQFLHWVGFALLFGAFGALARSRNGARALLGFAPFVLLGLYFSGLGTTLTTHAAVMLSVLPLLAPACLWRAPAFSERRLVLELLWLPGVFSMLTVAYTSANGVAVVYLGVLPVIVASVIALVKLTEEPSAVYSRSRYAALAAPAFCAAMLVAELHGLHSLAYSDARNARENDTRVTQGPFRGALAPAREASLLVAVDRDLKRIEQPGKTLAIFDSFSSGYLSTRMRPRTFTHWVVWAFEPKYIRSRMQATYGDPTTQPDFVLLIRSGMHSGHPWRRFARNYRTVIRRADLDYAILERR